jgi:hypothetical protein
MRRGLFVAGIVVLVLGIVLAGASLAIQAMSTSVSIPAGSADQLTPSGIGSTSVSISWSGADSSTTVYLISGSPTCSSPSGIVAHGAGASGSFSASLSSGTTYQLYACNSGAPVALNASYTTSGISILLLIGIIVAVIGVVITVLGLRARPKAKPSPAEPAPEGNEPQGS